MEDVLVKVGKFIFLADFIILGYEANQKVPIILGQPFLSIRQTLIDAHQGELTMHVNDQEVKLNIVNKLKFPTYAKNCNAIEFALGGFIEKKKYSPSYSTLLIH